MKFIFGVDVAKVFWSKMTWRFAIGRTRSDVAFSLWNQVSKSHWLEVVDVWQPQDSILEGVYLS